MSSIRGGAREAGGGSHDARLSSPLPPERRKRRGRRRRRPDKPAISARLVLDDHVKSDTGILSEDLFADLFPQFRSDNRDGQVDGAPRIPTNAAAEVYHVAIAPWAPQGSAETSQWTVVPVTTSSALAHSTVQFSPSSLVLQSFAATLQHIAPSKLSSHSRSGIEILVLDVVPFPLDTVFVSLEGDLAKRLEDGEGTFFREHPSTRAAGAAGKDHTPEGRLTAALRTALGTLKVVHADDLFPLPLPPHPVTHVPPNPAKVALCEPVAQGVLTPTTRIIVSRGRSHSKKAGKAAPIPAIRALNGRQGGEDDTENDQFFSAAEERYRTDVQTEDTGTDSATEEEEQAEEGGIGWDEDELSDDSMDEMIALQMPTLPPTAASGVSTAQAGTPMTIGRGRRTNGISTPMSVFSSYTATTARPDRPKGRLFKAQGLMQKISDALLHPKPGPDDDEEARVYVDVRDLPRIGCFSGDWVRLEAAEEPPQGGFGHFGLGNFDIAGLDEPVSRPARVFGLPEGYSQRSVARILGPKSAQNGRRPSFFESHIIKTSSPTAYASPILLANLESPACLRISPLKRSKQRGIAAASKQNAPLSPPLAREVILQQVRTPLTTERSTQSIIMAAVKWHFEQRLRIIRAGDLIAVPIDTSLGRALQEPTAASDTGSTADELFTLAATSQSDKKGGFDGVAWFKVNHAEGIRNDQSGDEERQELDEDLWGPTVRLDTSVSHLEQAGSVTSKVPGTEHSVWPYYLGIRAAPSRSLDSHAPLLLTEPQQAYTSPLHRELRNLLAAGVSDRAVQLKMPPLAILIASTQRSVGKATVAEQACADLGLHTFVVDAYDILDQAGGAGGSDMKTEAFLRARAERAMSCGPQSCVLLIRHIEALTAERMAGVLREVLAGARALIATTAGVDEVTDGVRGLFTHEFTANAPDEREREGILRSIIDDAGLSLDPEVDLGSVALKTAALVAGDLVDVVGRARTARLARLERLCASATDATNSTDATGTQSSSPVSLSDVLAAGGPPIRGISRHDLDQAVDSARRNFADAIGAPKIPSVTWDDVGGLAHIKHAVAETIQLPLERPELFARGAKKRSGILLYGPPGTGKTLLAKAIATEYSLNFFSVKGPELLNMYIGESEANVRRVFARARDARPCVVFFDELDSVAPKRGNQGDSGGVMDRIVSQLLAELDGMSSGGGGGDDGEASVAGGGGAGVFVIGATNRPDLLDPALLRPGRFDKMLYLGVSDTHDKQLKIMEALTRTFNLHPAVSLRDIVSRLPFTYTGADFYALCTDAMLKAVTRQAAAVDAKIAALNSGRGGDHDHHHRPPATAITTAAFFDRYATPEDLAVSVTEQDFRAAHRELVPSVSAGELAHYERVRAAFEGGGGLGPTAGNRVGPKVGRLPGRLVGSENSFAGKGKGKWKAVFSGSRKGKEVAVDSDDGDEDDVDGAEEGELGNASNGRGRDKGKGKAVATFHDGASDDDGLYES